ncbi:hypothetical protein GE09DRAFT_1290671 [Coniochaeta sp. 2T2.1]|nr:hypothetical protein GE09DRAFT_1290671 [Coniochaeta sp. 2T2.1]
MDDGNLAGPSGHHPQNTADEAVLEASESQNRPHNVESPALQLSRWWSAASVFPMMAGALGPVASAFSICALVRPWRQSYPPNTDIDTATFVEDPPWLTIVNAIQLAVAVIANLFLLLNMARRIRFTVAQPITIVGWYISVICLVVLLSIVSGPELKDARQPEEDLVWSQAFYYAIWAAILYFVDASLMSVTLWGSWSGHYSKDFNLTTSQRTLMLQTVVFLVHLLLGALVFSAIEDWQYLNAVYWADVTILTVGFGDFTVTTNLGRALLFPYALVGIISLGLIIASIRDMVLERRRNMDRRIQERSHHRVVRRMVRRKPDGMLMPLPRGPSRDCMALHELESRRSESKLLRKIERRAAFRRRWVAFFTSACLWFLLLFVGAAVFVKCEKPYQGWTYYDSYYFCYVSLLTIGYGDLTPVSNAGKSFVFWSLLALPSATIFISNAGDTVVKFVRDATIRIGHITILPGDHGFIHSAKGLAHHLTCGNAFRHVASLGQRDMKDIESQTQRQPRATNTKEWVSYLGLIDEDERHPDMYHASQQEEEKKCNLADIHYHEKVKKQKEGNLARGSKQQEQARDEHERLRWSWSGSKSPVLGGPGESEWMLGRLVLYSVWGPLREAGGGR